MSEASTTRPVRVAIIGAGFSGIAAATSLIRKGIEDFVIFEAAPGLGGTWWHNRYPGAEVDLESHIYSFSFEQYDWSRTHAGWEEILEYLTHVAEKWNLTNRIKLNERVNAVNWDDESDTYTVSTSSGQDHGVFTSVISCVGFLNIPLIPPFARGDHPYKGTICHTSRWPEGVTFNGKRVGVLGTGSSGVQIVSEAVKTAEKVTIFQIEPNWILPKNARDFTPEEREEYADPKQYFKERSRLYEWYDDMQAGGNHARAEGAANQRRFKEARDYLHSELSDRPDLIELVTPDFPFESRRTVNSDDYYQAIARENVEIIPRAADHLTETGIVDSAGNEYELDLIVLATGFDAANYLGELSVTGRDGTDLHEYWQGEPAAYLGMMVPNFPNFFMMYGPNTNSIPLVTFYEAQAEFISSAISNLQSSGACCIEVRPEAYEEYNNWVQEELSQTVWGETRNYFQAQSGRIVSQWPDSPSKYIELLEHGQATALEYFDPKKAANA